MHVGHLVSKETTFCVSGKVKHYTGLSTTRSKRLRLNLTDLVVDMVTLLVRVLSIASKVRKSSITQVNE